MEEIVHVSEAYNMGYNQIIIVTYSVHSIISANIF